MVCCVKKIHSSYLFASILSAVVLSAGVASAATVYTETFTNTGSSDAALSTVGWDLLAAQTNGNFGTPPITSSGNIGGVPFRP